MQHRMYAKRKLMGCVQKALVIGLLSVTTSLYSMNERSVAQKAQKKAFDEHASRRLLEFNWSGSPRFAPKLLKSILECNADPNITSKEKLDTPLINACYFDKLGEENVLTCVKVLIQAGADLNKPGNLDRTPLHWAAYRGLPTVAAYLLEKGATVMCKDALKDRPIDLALLQEKREVVRLLNARHPEDDPDFISGKIVEFYPRYSKYVGL